MIKHYENDEIKITWQPNVCIHSTVCFRGLGKVFNPTQRPWIDIQGATSEQIIEQIHKCPSGALSVERKSARDEQEKNKGYNGNIEVSINGPLLVHGMFSLKTPDGDLKLIEKTTAFCRCGASANKPYCDGSHRKIDFKG